MKHTMIFVSSPYTHPDKNVEKERYLKAIGYVASLMNAGLFAISPIASCVEIANKHTLPTDWKYWENFCTALMERCDVVYVLMLSGWEDSIGVKSEIDIAKKLNIKIEYIKIEE